MSVLGSGLHAAELYEDALSVKEAELSMLRRIGAPEEHILVTQSNLAITYRSLGRREEALCVKRDVYSERLKLNGEEHETTLRAAMNYSWDLIKLERFEEAKALLRKSMLVARRVFGAGHDGTLRMRWCYGKSLYADAGASLDDLREAVTTLEETERTARRVLGSAHPETAVFERHLQYAQETLLARESPST